ncbi:MAG: Na+/H+ antiporter subunit E [Chlamydiia bacterium]|nr:Na+/H+ antiporter subunit E [Chlamydiia bacterium]
MIQTLFIHAALTLIWLLLSRSHTLFNFIIGYLIGLVILFTFPKILHSRHYLNRTLGFANFLIQFTLTFLKANYAVAKIILFTPSTVRPAFFSYDSSHLTRFELLVLSNCITLTPGTTTTDISPDGKTLTVHALQFTSRDAICAEIDHSITRHLLRFTR